MGGFMTRALAVGLVGAAAATTAGAQVTQTPSVGPGIYYEQGASAEGPLAKLDPTTMVRGGTKDLGKTMATSALTGGLVGGKPKMAMYYSGARAGLRASSRPVFQFHFDPKAQSASDPKDASGADAMQAMMEQMDSEMPPGAKHPHDLALVRLGTKKDERELVASMEMKPKDVVPFRVRHLAGSVYRVTPERELEPGEYGFLAVPKNPGTGGASDKLWDFGVDSP
jgi:hypothetical protein